MHFVEPTIRHYLMRCCIAGLLLFGLTACANLKGKRTAADFVPVSVVGVQHMGPDFNVARFYIDGASGSNIPRTGGGGGMVCCASLPRRWRPDMKAVVRWSVNDWVKDTGYAFKAIVPVEKYDEPGKLYVHFFPGGKVRVVSSLYSPLAPKHQIPYGPHDDASATVGVPVDELFSPEEKAEKKRKRDEYRKKYGDWR